MSEEYYVRDPEEESARGPYDVAQLNTLAEAGKVRGSTLYFDEAIESWVPIEANESLNAEVFPVRRKLTLKQAKSEDTTAAGPDSAADADDTDADAAVTTAPTTPPEPEPEAEGESVEAILTAARGETDDTETARRQAQWRERSAALALPTLAMLLLLSALKNMSVSWKAWQPLFAGEEAALAGLAEQPLAYLAGFDLLLAIIVYLGWSAGFTAVRLRALVGLGYFGFLYWAAMIEGVASAPYLLILTSLFHISLLVCSTTLNFKVFVTGALGGLIGAVGSLAFAAIAVFTEAL